LCQKSGKNESVTKNDAVGEKPGTFTPDILFQFCFDSELSLMRMKHCPLQFMVPFSAIKGFLDTLPHGQALPFCGDSQKYPRYVFYVQHKMCRFVLLKNKPGH
jgi:hypothetical protein